MKTKTTDTPFSNGTEFDAWKYRNCDQCEKYETHSTDRNKAKCKYAFDIDISQGTGEIPISTINYFGYAKQYNLADCPFLHCGRIRSYEDYQKAKRKAKKAKKYELPL